MTPVFDAQGHTVAWIDKDGNDLIVFNLQGGPLAFIDDGGVYTFSSAFCGFYEDGFFRDRSGNSVAFTECASGGPLTPITEITPIEPITAIPPITPIAPITPISPIGSLSWSQVGWSDFIGAT
ncbi:hypothetical protein V6x_54480 [Gimesia chilikensis]|uniref:4-fold beta flower domain-containing protein n=1 Tax=Gimesia chilikensis TaxID=2605989 RepID=A0A517WKC3_9PLAN|nr:hypothetical protein [Gimesia chilikensis]QDU05707.1 hypothetical protein V6x_54480 [Gimesia chilikensis]